MQAIWPRSLLIVIHCSTSSVAGISAFCLLDLIAVKVARLGSDSGGRAGAVVGCADALNADRKMRTGPSAGESQKKSVSSAKDSEKDF